MNKKFPYRRILLYVIFIFTVIQITSCKKVASVNNAAIYTPPPPPPIPLAVAGFWSEDPYYSGDANTYYPAGFVNISIDGGPLIKLYYVLPPTGPTDCNTTGVMKIQVSIGQHSWQAFNLYTNSLIRSGTFIITSPLCQLVKIL